ncbi:uncharacterized protein Dere_GG19432 [Drosophila erecta]|uniref:Uncharacterized protein n=2 Tax=Drosophila erecta TaxID=7220 RepID=B3NUX2_DROER|nr:uncharacterized protein Dere_GG19432 [Drosophila erecta]
MTLRNLCPKCILLVALLLLLDFSLAGPQQLFLTDDVRTETGTGPATAAAAGGDLGEDRLPLNDPSDLSAGLNLAPVGSLISAAANVVPPAPILFIRTAMNSGL